MPTGSTSTRSCLCADAWTGRSTMVLQQMPLIILLAFAALPLLELTVSIVVGQRIGLWPTLGLLVAAAILGGAVLHRQGIAVLSRGFILERDGEPLVPVIDGALIVCAGILLAVPGFVTDVVGLLLLIPPVRRWVAIWCATRVAADGEVHMRVFRRGPTQTRAPHTPSGDGPVIEGEFERLDEKPPKPQWPKDRRR